MTIRVLVFEYLSSGAFDGQPGAESLAREGRAMLTAVLADLGQCLDVEVICPSRDRQVEDIPVLSEPRPSGSGEETAPLWSRLGQTDERLFRQAARQADFAVVIAPEFDDLLARYCTWAIEEGCRLLGPSVEAVRLTADKLRLAEYLEQARVPTIPTVVSPTRERGVDSPSLARRANKAPWVCKPRFGAGSQATFFVESETELLAVLDRAREEGFLGEMIVQPFVPSRDGPVSLACLVGPKQRFPLVLMRQLLSEDGRFIYLGGERALDLDEEPYLRLALDALDAIPGLTGYVGLDLLWPVGADRPVVVEINPRLTTSYVGLRALCEGNLMQTLLDLILATHRVEPPVFRPGKVRFTPDGTFIA